MRKEAHAACVLAGVLLMPSIAGAGIPVPDPTKCTFPAFIRVVGTKDGIPDASGTFTITIRDFTNLPIAGSAVTLEFANCSDTRLSASQLPDVVIGCGAATITGVTNALGNVTFTVLGAGTVAGCTTPPACAPGAGVGCVRIVADGFIIGNATSVIFDPDGAHGGAADGINSADRALVLLDVGCALAGGPYRGRSDFSQDGAINNLDLSFYNSLVLMPAFQGKGSVSGNGGGQFCPGPVLVSQDSGSTDSRRNP